MNKGESYNDGCKGAPSRTEDMTGVDGDFDVAGGGGNDCAVDAARWVWITKRSVSERTKGQEESETCPDPDG
jgi:hypothetical protein